MNPFLKFAQMVRADRKRFERDFREANAKLFARCDAERAKGYGGCGLTPDDISAYDDINSRTYGGLKR